MTRIAQLDDKGAVVAWSPVGGEYADVIALGSKEKGGIGFDDYGGELQLYDFDIANPHGSHQPRLLGSIATATRFGSIAWTPGNARPHATADADADLGLLAGGMLDGTVCLWKPSSLLRNATAPPSSDGAPSTSSDPAAAPLATVTPGGGNAGGITALKFNPHEKERYTLACGGTSGEVWVMETGEAGESAVKVYGPGGEGGGSAGQAGAEITDVAWNSQVPHILASSAANGTVVVWDLRQRKPWCQLRCESNSSSPVSAMAWNPTQGLHMMTASSDDRSPGLKLWDLRSSTTMPLTTLEGHTGGVLSLDWCPHDDTLMMSCGKDNRTLMWDLYSLQAIAEIPNEDPSGGQQQQQQQPQQQQCQQQQFHSQQSMDSFMYGGGLGTSQQKRYSVKWSPIRRGVVSTCSFDRKVQIHSVVSLATKCGRPPKWMSPGSGVSCGFGGVVASINASQRYVTIDTVVEQPELVKASSEFEQQFHSSTDCITYCHSMAERANDDYESQVWSFMQIMFEVNAREQLLSYLGFDPEAIHQKAMEYTEDGSTVPEDEEPTPPMSNNAENTVKDALLVGNFEAAVECCIRSGNMADALMLASCGGADLWAKTQAEYFARQGSRRPFLSLVSAVVQNQLSELVSSSDPSKWKETLAVLSTYGKSDEFPALCAELGDRLEEAGDFADASLCYMCALNLGKAVKYWKVTLEDANRRFGGMDLLSLQDFVEKVTVFMQALDPSVEVDDEVSELFAEYAKVLANQGLLVEAAKYLRGNTQECKELRDRIYRSRMGQFCPDLIASNPEFPYNYTNVGVSRDLYGITVKQSISQTQPEVMQEQMAQPFSEMQQQQQQQQYQQMQYDHQQQTMQHQKQMQQQTIQQQPESAPPSLPPGWVELVDPSSGRTYYANENTGESSWDPPAAPAPAPQPAPVHNQPSQPSGITQNYSGEIQQPSPGTAVNGTPSKSRVTTMKVANKYGDGFVTSASNPQLAERYGNVGTSNPYSDASRPGTAAAALGPNQKKPPVSGTLNPESITSLSADHKYLSDGLLQIVDALGSVANGAMEKKQAMEAQKGVAVFLKTLGRGGVDDDVVDKVSMILSGLQNRDYGMASSVVTSLVSNEWRDHKDWLKGMKFLVQMAAKRL